MPTAAAVRRVILGTAGHIDHGKTTLVERLTGTRTDRLPEEQERGMTIDVGYAAFALPDGTEAGLLDVPGHERLVRTMVAGATAMDLALLVVAADDGPMPQTREHVDILDLLEVRRVLVCMTKVDLVAPEAADLVEEQVRELLSGTGFADARILRVSSATGEGLDALKAAIAEACPPAREERADLWAFRMPVLRAFTAPGRGTVLTGIPLAGRLAEGEEVVVLPGDARGRVRGIQVHHRPAPVADAHHRAALAVADVDAAKVERGQVVTTPGGLQPTKRLAVRLRALRRLSEPIEHRRRARLHVGAAQAMARVHVLEGTRVSPGETAVVELETFEPVVTAPGDRFVLRAENASATYGGGVVVEVLGQPGAGSGARLPRRAGIARALLERAARLDDPRVLVTACLLGRGEEGASAEDVAAVTGLRPDALPAILEEIRASGEAVRIGRAGFRLVHAPAFARTRTRVLDAVKSLHAKDRAMASLSLAAVRTAVGRGAPAVIEAAVESLVADGSLQRTEQGGVRQKGHAGEMSGPDRQRAERLLALLERGAGQPPAPEDLEASLQLPAPEVLRLLKVLENQGKAFRADHTWFHAGWLEGAKARLAEHARRHGGFTPADARDLLGSSRKWVIPLLEALDKVGFSRRAGEKRVVR
jgi:selenocysteine-specific elongation factor